MATTEVKVVITGQDKASAKIQKMGKTFQKVGIGMLAMGTAIAGGIFALAKSYADAGDEIAKMSKRTGFAVETLSELRHVAEITGTELGSIEKATKRMSRAIIDAERGLETYARVFRDLGLEIEDLRRMNPEEQFWAISNAIADLEDQTLKAALAQEVFGRAGTDLLPMLEEGAEGIAALRQEAHDLGVVFDEESAKEAEEFKDALARLQTSMQGVGKELIQAFLPTLTDFATKAVEAIKKVKEWVSENEGLVRSLLIIAGVLAIGGAVLLGLSMIARAITAISAALVIMHSLSGPGGWAILAAGAGIAAAGIIGLKGVMEDLIPATPIGPPATGPHRNLQRFAAGGIVTSPTLAMIGEAGPEAVVPLGGGLGGEVHHHWSIGNFMGDQASLRAFFRMAKEVMAEEDQRTTFAGINKLGYMPGSSSL